MFVRKIGIFCAWCVICNTSNAARLDISRLTHDGEFSATVGAAFKTGMNAAGTNQTNFTAGRLDEMALNFAYTPTDNLTLNFSTGNNYSDSQIGFQYKLIKRDAIKVDVLADYGIAWTKNAHTHNRYGDNNIDFGVRVTGRIKDFQWAVMAQPQFVWAVPANFWNVNTTTQLMYYFFRNLATNLQFDFNVLEIQQPRTRYDNTLQFGVTYNFSERASAKPFIKYHFKTQEFRNTFVSYYDWWQIGLAVSAQF